MCWAEACLAWRLGLDVLCTWCTTCWRMGWSRRLSRAGRMRARVNAKSEYWIWLDRRWLVLVVSLALARLSLFSGWRRYKIFWFLICDCFFCFFLMLIQLYFAPKMRFFFVFCFLFMYIYNRVCFYYIIFFVFYKLKFENLNQIKYFKYICLWFLI